MTSSEVAVTQRTPAQEVVASIRSQTFADQLKNALPGNVSVERFQRVTVTAIQQNPDVIQADRGSLFSAVIKCAQDGLLPDGREAALVVFKGRVSYMPMIGGFRKVAAKSGISINTFVVYERDTFDYQFGLEPHVEHKPPALGEPRGEPIGAYAVATDSRGQKYLEVMSKQEIEKVRAVSRAATSEYGPWVNWWDEMARKTVGRRIFKQLPLGELDERAASMLDADDATHEFPNGDRAQLAPPNDEEIEDTVASVVEVEETSMAGDSEGEVEEALFQEPASVTKARGRKRPDPETGEA